MEEYLKRHEAFVREVLATAGDGYEWAGLARFHATQIAFMQHERLIHLLVTLFFALFALTSLLVTVVQPRIEMAILVLLFLVLLVPYIAHYFKLENGVQRWYHLANQIEKRAGNVSQDYRAPVVPNRAI